MERFNYLSRIVPQAKMLTGVGTAVVMLGLTGCSTVAPSPAARGAGTGATIGALGGAAVGANSSMGTATGLVGGALAGAAIGGLVGMIQQSQENREQENLQQARGYAQDQAKKKQAAALMAQARDEELEIMQGFKISEFEMQDAQRKADESAAELKALTEKRAAAIQRKKTLDTLKEKTVSNNAAIAALKEELTRLQGGDTVTLETAVAGDTSAAGSAAQPAGPPSTRAN